MVTENEILTILTRETEIILAARAKPVAADTPLASLGFDSLSFVELLIAIERHFKIKLIELGLKPEDTRTLGTLARCVHRALTP